MVKHSPIFKQLVEAWLQKLREDEKHWPTVESYLQKVGGELTIQNETSQAEIEVQKLLHGTWYYDFEASCALYSVYQTFIL